MTMSPSTGPEGIASMQSSSCSGKWSLYTSDVNRGPEPCQSGTALTFSVLCFAYTRVVSQIDGAVWAYVHAHDDHYLTRLKYNSLLTDMITPHTYIQTCIRGSLRLAPNYRYEPYKEGLYRIHRTLYTLATTGQWARSHQGEIGCFKGHWNWKLDMVIKFHAHCAFQMSIFVYKC